MTNPQTKNRVDTYIEKLDKSLKGIAPEEKQEIIHEIRAHILDSISAEPDQEAAIDRVFRLLGKPKELADRYRTESLLTRAGHSFSPWLLLRTSWRWAKLGVKGTIAFFLAMFGYSIALGLTVSMVLKPIMPSRIGIWLGPHSFNIGISTTPGVHELLGQWFVPIAGIAAFAIAVGTTQALRWLFKKRSLRPIY